MLRFRRLRESDLEQVLRWRTSPFVTRYMNTDVPFDLDKQRAWFHSSIENNPAAAHWIIELDGRGVGAINLAGLDRAERRTSYGFYIGEEDARQIGALVPPYFYNHAFPAYGLDVITAEVFAENEAVRAMHLFHGHRQVGIRKCGVVKNGVPHDVVHFELRRADWDSLKKRFGHYTAEFE